VRLGGAVLALLVATALAAPWLGTVDPTLFDADSRDLVPGSMGRITTLDGDTIPHRFIMGSDSFGRDIYSRVIYGTRVSLAVGLLAALLALAFGVLAGLSAGYLRWLDGVLMRFMDGLMAIPAILIAIALVALWRASLPTVIVAIAIPEIPRVTRLVRSLVLAIREEPYVEAARALGAKPFTILRRYVFFNVVQNVPVLATLNAADAVLTLTALGFLGYGVQPTQGAEWGYDVSRAVSDAASGIWWTGLFPGLAIVLLVTGLTLLGEGLNETINPVLRKRAIAAVVFDTPEVDR
jgi:peptide/nickel transport system permease protein